MSRPMTSAEEAVWAAVFARKFKDLEGSSPKHLHVPGKDEEYRDWHAGIVREALEHAAHAVDALRYAVEHGALEEGHGRDSNTVRYARGATAFHPDRLDHEFWVLHSPYPDGTWRGLHKSVDVMLSSETMQPLHYGPPYEVQPPTLDGAPSCSRHGRTRRTSRRSTTWSGWFPPASSSPRRSCGAPSPPSRRSHEAAPHRRPGQAREGRDPT